MIFDRIIPPQFLADETLSANLFRFMSRQQAINQAFYRDRVVAYGEWYFKTEAGEAWREYMASVEDNKGAQFTANIHRPGIGDLMRWKMDTATGEIYEYSGLELTVFHIVDCYRQVLPFVKTIPCSDKNGIHWLANDPTYRIAAKLLSCFIGDIHYYVDAETVSGTLTMKALSEVLNRHVS